MTTPVNFLTKRLPAAFCLAIAASPGFCADPTPVRLNLVIVEGDHAVNNVRQRVTAEPVVRVEDENHAPIAQAAVVFTLPTDGASGDFSGSKTLTVMSDTSGLASAKGMRTSASPGIVPIHVSASYRGLSARTIIVQESVLPTGGSGPTIHTGMSGKLITVLAIAGAAAAGGTAFAIRGKGNATALNTPLAPAPIGITPGAGIVTGGH